MTGIERLRDLADKYAELGKDHTTIDVVPSGMAMLFSNIATQIEREHAEDCYRMVIDHGTVSRVASEMERHVLGVEGMEDSPVARWARELRAALGGMERDHAEDVSMSAYDLLPEDREAIAWVREHGGVEGLRRMFQDADNRRVELCAPEDSWERLEEDARKFPCEYFDQSHGCGGCPHYPSECHADKACDIVRRAKALAGDA